MEPFAHSKIHVFVGKEPAMDQTLGKGLRAE